MDGHEKIYKNNVTGKMAMIDRCLSDWIDMSHVIETKKKKKNNIKESIQIRLS